MEKSVVLLTVPHAVCPTPLNVAQAHPCDLLAEDAAEAIYQHQRAAPLIAAPVVPERTTRQQCDLNRRECRDHPWREQLRERMCDAATAFVLDVHSYPAREPRWAEYEVVVLDETPAGHDFQPYVASFVRFMRREGVRAAAFRGANNDIQQEARALGIRSMLLEVNEGLRNQPSRLIHIAGRTADWLTASVLHQQQQK